MRVSLKPAGQKLFSFTGLALTLLTACSNDHLDSQIYRTATEPSQLNFNNPDVTEKIIGENDLLPVLQDGANIPSKYAPLIDAFGLMSIGCTATHIGKGLAVTAGHCFRAPQKRSELACKDVTVKWGHRADKESDLTSRCTKVLAAQTNYETDYAIFMVDPVPLTHVEVDIEQRPKVATPLTIFSHPRARPLEWSQLCALETSAKGPWGTNQFSHQCDSEPGSSGGSVIDDQSLKVIGLHNGGMSDWNFATYLYDTPLAEFMDDSSRQPAPSEPTLMPDQKFGPFPNNASMLLTDFGTMMGRTMSFELLIDLETNKDFIVIEYGEDQVVELTGFQKRFFKNLTLPVKISYRSNRFIKSTLVLMQNIRIYK